MKKLTAIAVTAGISCAGILLSIPVSAQDVIQRGRCDFAMPGFTDVTKEERFMRIDRNSNGYIDRKEMVECLWPGDFMAGPGSHRWGEVVKLAEENIKTYDKDGDERISKAEAMEPVG